jgi:hypothetical protein
MRDYEESPLRMMDDLDDLDDSTEVDYDVNEWFPMMQRARRMRSWGDA